MVAQMVALTERHWVDVWEVQTVRCSVWLSIHSSDDPMVSQKARQLALLKEDARDTQTDLPRVQWMDL